MGTELQTYYRIFRDAYPKSEIIRYIINRLFGERVKFKRDVYVKNDYGLFNCGRSMGNVRVACDPTDEMDISKEFRFMSEVFIDVGAHIGKHAIKVAKDNPNIKVIAIEPTPETYQLLRDNVRSNYCNDNIHTFNFGCSDKEGTIKFNLDVSGSAMNSGVKRNGKIIDVQCFKLDDCGLKNIKVIKIDVEGMELKVLKGAKKILKRDHPIIYFEAWDKNAVFDIMKFLKQFKYDMIEQIDLMNWRAE